MTRKRQAGFAFLEAMIALAIAAGALGLMFNVLADGAGRSRSDEVKRLGLLVAESRLAAVGAEIPLKTGSVTGVDGSLIWRLGIDPYRMGPARSAAGDLFLVTVAVRSRTGSANAVELRSLRLAPQG